MRRTLLCLTGLLCAALAQAAPPDAADLINLSGRQRMLSQRIVKAYAQVGARVTTAQSRQLLADSAEQFAHQLDELRAVLTRPDQRETLAEIERLWPQVRDVAGAEPRRDKALLLHAQANELQRLSHRLAGLIEQERDVAGGRLVNLAGRQRMLTQRLAKAYMLRAWQIDSPQLAQEVDLAAIEFAAALELLAQAPENTAAIRREIESLQTQWEWFRSALEMEGAMSYRLLVADASESILASLERLVAMYARLGK